MKPTVQQVPYIDLHDIDKVFGVTKALQKVSLSVYSGEVVGFVGPNGAGKSTLMKVITGVLSPSSGVIRIQGKVIEKYTTKEAQEAGIACAYQDLSLCSNLSVYENFAMLDHDHHPIGRIGWRKKAQEDTRNLLERFFPGNGIDVLKTVDRLSLSECQIVEICKTLIIDNLKLLILDEPTSALSTDRAEQLHGIIQELSKKGVAIIYISHKLIEIKAITSRIVLLRNGTNCGECDPESISTDELVQLMGGESKKESRFVKSTSMVEKNALIQISDYSKGVLKDINLHVCKGEMVGISGLGGSGQIELLNAIFKSGKNLQQGKDQAISIQGTLSYISGDRSKEGTFPLWDICDNILISKLNQKKSKFFLKRKQLEQTASQWYEKLKFRAEGIRSPIMSLSGGNQQKALIARGVASGSDIIILNDPTAGVDIETKQEIYSLLNEAKEQGKSIILYSTEDSEMEICDRVYVMHNGMITEELEGDAISIANIVKASFEDKVNKVIVTSVAAKPKKERISSRLLLPVVTMLFMIFANAYLNPRILSYFGMKILLGSAIPLVFAALGQMFIVVSGDIDMGNGYSIGLVNVLVAVVLTGNPLIGVISLLVFLCAYIMMGVLIHVRNIPAIVVTLGAQFIWLGIALVLSPTPGGQCPAWLLSVYKFKLPIIPMPMLIAALAALLSWYILYRTKYGIILRGIGNNPVSVERSGWSQLYAKMTNYGLAALMIILSGMSYTAVCLGADANSASSYCMQSIATIILGGCELSGGIAEPIGVVVGAIAMSFIIALLISMKVDSNFQTAVTGMILIIVLAIKLVTHRKGARAK